MPLYKVTLTFTREELVDYLDQNKTFNGTIEAFADEEPTDVYQTPRAERPKRKSKVVESIVNRLKELGKGDVSQLRHALLAAGLSENSLSTGLAILQKEGRILRDPDDGEYYLSEREAA